MGYVAAMSNCLICRQMFSFNPVKVPSFRVDGVKEPICSNCMGLVNEGRKAAGLEPFAIPYDAYEACDESEIE